MTDQATKPAQGPKTRRPFIWQPPETPRPGDLFAGPGKRRRLLAYAFGEGLLNLRDRFLFALFRTLPPGFASRLGGRIGRFVGPRKYPELHRQLRRTLAIIRPDLDQAARDRLALDFFDNYGRVGAEYPLLNRLHALGRVRHENGEALQKLHAQGPVILLGLHVANWEVPNFVCAELGIVSAAIYKPPARAGQLRIAVTARKAGADAAAARQGRRPTGAAGAARRGCSLHFRR
jgi:KDO2-lipid IV(A) lauroyltransferase